MSSEFQNEENILTHYFTDDGTFPNNKSLPLVVLKNAFERDRYSPGEIESAFSNNGWTNSWRNGLYSVHHYHSTAHEALGVYKGWVKGVFGGPGGREITAHAGDVLIIPAGVAHKNLDQSADFRVVGAYPYGQQWDMNYGKIGERPNADKNIMSVQLPGKDPVYGSEGPLMKYWKKKG